MSSLSRQAVPTAVGSAEPTPKAQSDAAAGGYITLGETYDPMTGVWPAVDATNGPLTADAGATATAPSFTGLTLYSWNSGVFNLQSQNWVAVPTVNGPAANQCCANVTTNRGNYGSSGIGFSSHSDFGFSADTATVILAYWVNTATLNGVSTSIHETQLFAEHEGKMKGIRSMPAFWNSGGGNQMFYRVFTFKEARRRRFRVMMSANCWLAGVYVDTAANIQKTKNLPFWLSFGDSWAEPNNNVFASVGGNGAVAGTTWPNTCSLLYSSTDVQFAIATGHAIAQCHHGGTGWVVNNGGVNATTDTPGFSPFLSISQWNFSWNLWGAKKPMVFVAGGWNDGTTSAGVYQATVQAGFNRVTASDPLAPIMAAGIQDKAIVAGDGRDLSNTAIGLAVAATPQAIGFIDQSRNWPIASGIPAADIGPDGLHPTVKGGDEIGQNYAKQAARFQISRTRYLQMTTAAA